MENAVAAIGCFLSVDSWGGETHSSLPPPRPRILGELCRIRTGVRVLDSDEAQDKHLTLKQNCCVGWGPEISRARDNTHTVAVTAVTART